MRVPLSWLREHCPTDLDVGELADRLTGRVERGGHDRPWEGLAGVVVAVVGQAAASQLRPSHPGPARHREGDGRVAAGVANWAVGDRVPYAPPGSRVPALPEPL